MGAFKAAFAAALACVCLSAQAGSDGQHTLPSMHSQSDGRGTTTYWGEGAHYEITGPGVTVFFLAHQDGGIDAPLVRVAYVGDAWINVRAVSITVGERTFGPFVDGFGQPARVDAGKGLVVEALIFKIDSDEKWQMLDGVADASELGRPVIAVLEADAPYGIELDRASKQATGYLVKGFRELAVRSH